MRGAAGRRRGRKSYAQPKPQQQPPDHRNFNSSRDSDASLCSSHSSSVGIPGRSTATDYMNDRSFQLSAIRTINDYLSSHSYPICLKSPFPSTQDIFETLKIIMSRLNYPSEKPEDDIPIMLKHLNCPIKLNKSAFRTPGTPHCWPSFCAVLHWLVELAKYKDHKSSLTTTAPSLFQNTSSLSYLLNSYGHYIKGDDDEVEKLDKEILEKMERERDSLVKNGEMLNKEVKDLEAKLEKLKSEPPVKELVEKERSVLEEDVDKFHAIIAEVQAKIGSAEKVLEEKEKELEAKVEENRKICAENVELKNRIELQTLNARGVERMERELQAVERNIGEAEIARNAWEEKSWDLDSTLVRKFNQLEALSIECNQAMKRLKIGKDFQYMLNAKGTTPAEVLGIDYKSTVKPALDSFADDINKSSMEKLEELISLQQQSVEIAAKIEGKKKQIVALQSRIDEVEAQSDFLKKEMQDCTSSCLMEAKGCLQEVEAEAHNLDIVEREAAEMLKVANLNLQEAVKQSEEEIQMSARKLFALVDSVSKYKEYMSSKILDMKASVSETAAFVADAYKGSLPDFEAKR